MSADTHSAKAKVASDDPSKAPAAPERSDTQNPPQEKDTATLIKEAIYRLRNEEIRGQRPTRKDTPHARRVRLATAMRNLEEMDRKEGRLPDGTGTNGAHKAS